MILYFAGTGRQAEKSPKILNYAKVRGQEIGVLLSYNDIKKIKNNTGGKRFRTICERKGRIK